MTDTPAYEVLQKQGNIEIRQYVGYIQAEVIVNGKGYRSAIESGFNVLAGYIFGNNIARQKIDMTKPVTAARSERIAMTTPVTVRGEDNYTVAFVMPSAYTMDTLPIPRDENIHFTAIPSRKVAAIRFSGYFNSATIQRNKALLKDWLEKAGLETDGDFTVAGYNPPWVPGFLARNEVIASLAAKE